MLYNSQNKECECIPGYTLAADGTSCFAQINQPIDGEGQKNCSDNTTWDGSKCSYPNFAAVSAFCGTYKTPETCEAAASKGRCSDPNAENPIESDNFCYWDGDDNGCVPDDSSACD